MTIPMTTSDLRNSMRPYSQSNGVLRIGDAYDGCYSPCGLLRCFGL